MTQLHTDSTPLGRMSRIVFSLPAGARSEVLWHCLGFVRAAESSELTTIGPIRAAMASYWEEMFGQPVPICQLRELLVAARSKHLALITDIDEAESPGQVRHRLAALLSHLGEACRGGTAKQLPMFDAAHETPRVAPEPASCPAPGIVRDLSDLIRLGLRFPTIYADPPWPYDNEASRGAAVRHYPTMPLEQILAEPVEQLAARNAHLHLWATNAFLAEALQVMDAWGFTFKSCLVWIKPELGLGNYWRLGHEYLLLGTKGSLCFRDRQQRSWVRAHRTVHSKKPGIVRLLVEKVSPGPYLELYGREEIPNSQWTVHGNNVGRRLC